jgi:hypothetical protein
MTIITAMIATDPGLSMISLEIRDILRTTRPFSMRCSILSHGATHLIAKPRKKLQEVERRTTGVGNTNHWPNFQ